MRQDRDHSKLGNAIVRAEHLPPAIQGGMFSQMALSNTNELMEQLCRELRSDDRCGRVVETIQISIRMWEE